MRPRLALRELKHATANWWSHAQPDIPGQGEPFRKGELSYRGLRIFPGLNATWLHSIRVCSKRIKYDARENFPGGTGPPNSVPQGTVMQIALATDPKEGKVTHATFRITFPGTGTLHHSFKFPATALCAISGFQVNLVGPPIGTPTPAHSRQERGT
jgi:hypothetical protein